MEGDLSMRLVLSQCFVKIKGGFGRKVDPNCPNVGNVMPFILIVLYASLCVHVLNFSELKVGFAYSRRMWAYRHNWGGIVEAFWLSCILVTHAYIMSSWKDLPVGYISKRLFPYIILKDCFHIHQLR